MNLLELGVNLIVTGDNIYVRFWNLYRGNYGIY
jgi:hypothetical protein